MVPKEYIPGVLKGLQDMMGSGTLAGFPVVDVTATLYDGSFHDVDSSVLAFQIAARAAFREGMKKAGVQLLEPIMQVRRRRCEAAVLVVHNFCTGISRVAAHVTLAGLPAAMPSSA